MKRTFGVILVTFITFTLILSACGTPATPPPAATQPPAAPATEAPPPPTAVVPPTAAPTEAPTVVPTVDKKGGRFVYIDTSGFYPLDPFVTPWFTYTQGFMYDSLVALALDYRSYVSNLAESWEIAPDGLKVTFTLKSGITFHDGTPCDATAVKWNLDRYALGTEAQIDNNWPDYIASVEAPDALTVVVNFKKSYAPFFSDLTLSYIISPTAFEKLGKDGFTNAPVGTGPFMPTEIIPNTHVLYVRNPDYNWGPAFVDNKGPMNFDEVEIKFVVDEPAAFAALEAGEASAIGLSPSFLSKAKANDKIALQQGQDNTVYYLGFNNKIWPFTDKDFRLAVNYALNREEIIQAVLEGEAMANYSYLAPATWGFDESLNKAAAATFAYNPDKAKELLAGLGYKDDNGDNVLEKDGKVLSLKVVVPVVDFWQRTAEIVQSQLAEVGIKMTIEQMEASAIPDLLNKCSMEFFFRQYGLADPSILSVFYGPRVGAGNRNCWADAKTDELFAVTDSTVDPVKRQEAVNTLVTYLSEVRPNAPLLSQYVYTAYNKNIQGLKFDMVAAFYLNDAYMTK